MNGSPRGLVLVMVWPPPPVLYIAAKKFNLFLFCFFGLCLPVSGQESKDPTPIHTNTTVPETARFEIVQSTIAARWLFKLDRQTGTVYQIVQTKEGEVAWERMEALSMPIAATSGVHYEIFMSGIAARFMFLMNLDTGKTWQLQSSTDPKTNERINTWVPILTG